MVTSAGLVVYRFVDGDSAPVEGLELLLVHPGGPFWARKDEAAWSIPKGEIDPDEEPLTAALREFREELGLDPPNSTPADLGSIRQAGGKAVLAWAVQGSVDTSALRSNEVTLEWPRGSGREITFPEVDRAEWCTPELARHRLVRGQVPFVDRLVDLATARNIE